MPNANRFDSNMKPSRGTRLAAVALVASAALAGVTSGGVASTVQSGGFKGMDWVTPHK